MLLGTAWRHYKGSNVEALKDIASRVELVTFDCYGTLIDWNTGIRGVLERIVGECGVADRVAVEDLLAAYVSTEAGVEAQAWRPYRRVQAETLLRLAEQFQLSLLPEHRDLLAETLPDWLPFADTCPALVQLKARFKLGILSNIDRDLFARTARHFPVGFDLVVTAEDVRAYKPAHAHFLRGLDRVRQDRSRLLHVAESAYHDGIPTSQLGLPWVWINRTGSANRHGAEPVAEFSDLESFVRTIG